MERQEAGFEPLSRDRRDKLRTHGIARVRGWRGVQPEPISLFLQFQNRIHHVRAVLRLGSEHLQEGSRVHRGLLLNGERVIAIADVSHRGDSPFPHQIHPLADVFYLLLERFRVSQSVDLVNEAGHPCPFAEKLPHIRQLHMAMGIHKARDNGPLQEYLLGIGILTLTDSGNSSFIVIFHITVPDRFGTVQGV